jgi:hypothetical protein
VAVAVVVKMEIMAEEQPPLRVNRLRATLHLEHKYNQQPLKQVVVVVVVLQLREV